MVMTPRMVPGANRKKPASASRHPASEQRQARVAINIKRVVVKRVRHQRKRIQSNVNGVWRHRLKRGLRTNTGSTVSFSPPRPMQAIVAAGADFYLDEEQRHFPRVRHDLVGGINRQSLESVWGLTREPWIDPQGRFFVHLIHV